MFLWIFISCYFFLVHPFQTQQNETYCWCKKSCTSWYGKFPLLYIPSNAIQNRPNRADKTANHSVAASSQIANVGHPRFCFGDYLCLEGCCAHKTSHLVKKTLPSGKLTGHAVSRSLWPRSTCDCKSQWKYVFDYTEVYFPNPETSPFCHLHLPSALKTGYITSLDMCKVCTEAVHSVALWTRVTVQVWTCVKQSIP